MKNLSTKIIINVSPDEVWYTFSKFHAFELWNPFIGDIEGEVSLGAKLKVTLYPSMKRINERMNENLKDASDGEIPLFDISETKQLNKSSSFKVKVTQYKEGSALRWERRSLILGSFIHEFRFHPQDTDQTLFENNIQMGGFLVNLGWETYIKHMYQSGLEEMNLALKAAVESDEFYIDDDLAAERF